MRAKIVADGQGLFYGIRIDCPAGHNHVLPVDWTPAGQERSPHSSDTPTWHFNGDLERPTLSPSILTRSGHHTDGDKTACWCNIADRFPGRVNAPDLCYVCHCFVRDGRIEFLGDCTHALAGKTVDLP